MFQTGLRLGHHQGKAENVTRGPFLESPGNFSGPKSNIHGQIEIKRIRARVLASKLLHFVSLTDIFITLDV